MNLPLQSPTTGGRLAAESPDLLLDVDGRRWPVIDGIPFLRVGRDALVHDAVDRLARGDREGALVTLLGDQDDWWTGEKPDASDVRRLIRERDRTSLRDAMASLAFDRVGDYFAHRWSDPTFLAGLGLLDAYWRPTADAFELACGIGQYGRELSRRGVTYTGGDVVFAKLWLARHWVLPPAARLVCFDAAAPWPLGQDRFDLVFCHDAFYFLEPKSDILANLRRIAGAAGRVALSHIHNSGADTLSAGHAMSADAVARMFPEAEVYDDDELTRAFVGARLPNSASLADLTTVEAFSVEDRPLPGGMPSIGSGGPSLPSADAMLRLNPLYRPDADGFAVAWPSRRYEAEYAARATYPDRLSHDDHGRLSEPATRRDAARRGILVDLPERW